MPEFTRRSAVTGASVLATRGLPWKLRRLYGAIPEINVHWETTRNKAPRQAATALTATPDGGYVVGSWAGSGSSDVSLVKFQPDGTIDWQQRIDEVDGATPEFAVSVGTDTTGALYVTTEGDGWQVMKTTLQGEPEWIRDWRNYETPHATVQRPMKLGVADDGGCAVAAHLVHDPSDGRQTNYIATTRFDADGTRRWQRRYEVDSTLGPVVDVTVDGATVHVVSNPGPTFRVDAITSETHERQMRVNLVENPQGLTYAGGRYTNAIRLSDGGYLASFPAVGARRFDASGEVVWNTVQLLEETDNEARETELAVADDGRVGVVGYLDEQAGRPGWMTVLNKDDGSIVATRQFTDNSGRSRTPSHIAPTDDGWVIAGDQQGERPRASQLWFGHASVVRDNTPDLPQVLGTVGLVGFIAFVVARGRRNLQERDSNAPPSEMEGEDAE